MDIEKIQRLVDGYIGELAAEFGRYSQEMVASAEGAQEEMELMRLPKELFMDLWDPQAIFQTSKTLCTLHTDHIFLILQGLDDEEELAARHMIAARLRRIVDDLMSGMSGSADILDEE